MYKKGNAICDECGVEQPSKTELDLDYLLDDGWDWKPLSKLEENLLYGFRIIHICGRCKVTMPKCYADFKSY